MGAKSRGNYPIGMFISQDVWDKMFPKDGKDGFKSEIKDSDTITNVSNPILGEIREGKKEGSS